MLYLSLDLEFANGSKLLWSISVCKLNCLRTEVFMNRNATVVSAYPQAAS